MLPLQLVKKKMLIDPSLLMMKKWIEVLKVVAQIVHLVYALVIRLLEIVSIADFAGVNVLKEEMILFLDFE